MSVADDAKQLAENWQSWGAFRRFGAKHPNTWAIVWAVIGYVAGSLVVRSFGLFF